MSPSTLQQRVQSAIWWKVWETSGEGEGSTGTQRAAPECAGAATPRTHPGSAPRERGIPRRRSKNPAPDPGVGRWKGTKQKARGNSPHLTVDTDPALLDTRHKGSGKIEAPGEMDRGRSKGHPNPSAGQRDTSLGSETGYKGASTPEALPTSWSWEPMVTCRGRNIPFFLLN